MNSKLATYNMSWELDTKGCVCDLDFVQLSIEKNWNDKAVFHFGTGSHHTVGKELCNESRRNSVLGVTANLEEHLKYVDFIQNNPSISNYYKVMYCDIYTLDSRLFPRFDIICLFHLCEYYSSEKNSYSRLDDESLLRLCVNSVTKDGTLTFYKGSNGFGKLQLILKSFERKGLIQHREDFNSLALYSSLS